MRNLVNTISNQDTTTKVGLTIVGLVIVPLIASIVYRMITLGSDMIQVYF